jgi:hypothetical protein
MPDDLTLKGQVRLLTFAVQIAFRILVIRRSFYRVVGLLKDVVHHLVVGKMQLAEGNTILHAQALAHSSIDSRSHKNQ